MTAECRPPPGTPDDDGNIWRLTPEQSRAFLNSLLNPPDANEALKAAAKRNKHSIATPPEEPK